MQIPLALLATLLTATFAAAQTPAPPRPPQPTPIVSPEIAPDHRVTFRLQAANAHEISVSGQWARNVKTPLTPGEGGVWSATVGPVEPGIYEYSLIVDGLSIVDPGNPAIKPQRQPRASILHIPSDPPAPWDLQNVPHGTLHAHTYASPSLGRSRELVVYTPPGYEQSAEKLPLLVLIHGSGDNQAAWSQHGKAHWIFDNLLAQKKAQPMIVVMPDGHSITGREERGKSNVEAFEQELLEEILPLVEATYRVQPGAANHAIAGLSMGGGHALNCGLRHADRFAWIGSFSGAVPADRVAESLKDSAALNERAKLLWVAVGKDDFLRQRNEQFIADLDSKGIRHTWVLSEGDHSWPVWRRYLVEFAPLLFQAH